MRQVEVEKFKEHMWRAKCGKKKGASSLVGNNREGDRGPFNAGIGGGEKGGGLERKHDAEGLNKHLPNRQTTGGEGNGEGRFLEGGKKSLVRKSMGGKRSDRAVCRAQKTGV